MLDFIFGPQGDPVVQAVAKYLAAVGVHFDIKTVSVPALTADVQSKNFPIMLTTVGSLPPPGQWLFFLPNGYFNVFDAHDPIVNRLYYAGLRARDPSQHWKPMYRRITQKAYFIPILVADVITYYAKQRVAGVATGPGRNGLVLPTEWRPR